MTPIGHRIATLALLVAGCASGGTRVAPHVDVADILLPEERLAVDDVIEVRVFAEPDLSGTYRIAADGTIDYPFAGRILLAGLHTGEIQALLTEKLKEGYLRNPQVSVMVKEWNNNRVIVMGQVQKPGSVAYFPNMTIVDAIASAGGFTGIAAKNSVMLRREENGAVHSRQCPVADISEGRASNVVLRPKDIVVVEERMF
jgi:protein involved in polysaccharide export with SLBB domain